MASEQQTAEPTTVELDYSGDNATPTYFTGYTKDGGLDKASRERVAQAYAEQTGAKSVNADSLDYRVVRDDVGRSLTVEVTAKK